MNEYTEQNIPESGWYFYYPEHPSKYEFPKYVLVDDDAIEGNWLKCKKYQGTYIGPITPPEMSE